MHRAEAMPQDRELITEVPKVDKEIVAPIKSYFVPGGYKFTDTYDVMSCLDIVLKARILCQQIQVLDFSFCAESVGDGKDLAQKMKGKFKALHTLVLDGCTDLCDEAVQSLCSSFPKLKKLSLYWTPNLTSVSICAMAEYLGSHLQELNLSGLVKGTDVGVQSIATHCSELRSLNLTRMQDLTDAALIAIGSSLPRLSYLNLYACGKFGDPGIMAVATGCPDLEFIDVCGSDAISDAGVQSLVEHCCKLKTLDLKWVTALTDVSLTHIAQLKHLKTLSLYGNTKITDAGLKQLSTTSSRIETLDLNGCSSIQNKTLEDIEALFPNVDDLPDP